MTPVFFLVLDNLPVELVSERINRSIHVVGFRRGKEISPCYMEIRFGFVQMPLDNQRHFYPGDLVAMASYRF